MEILINGLPRYIDIDGKEYEINCDYQTCLRIIEAFEDRELTQSEKMSVLIDLLYKDTPNNIETAVLQGIKFLDCGECTKSTESGETIRKYSFKHDERYIFSGVDRVLSGRLSKGDFVHWWEFVMAFMELPEDCIMSKILYFRTQYAKGKLSKDEKRVYAENRNLFELPEELTQEEEAAKDKFMRSLYK